MTYIEEYSFLREAVERMYNSLWSTFSKYQPMFYKGDITLKELASKVDYASASAFREYLEREHIKNKVVSEEWFDDYIGKEYPVYIVDPIDGTSNFIRGVPFSSISIAISSSDDFNDIYAGIVMNVFTREIYFAYKGNGSFKNGRKLRVSNIKDTRISHMSIAITHAIPFKSPSLYILRYTNYPRHFGSAALEDCFVAEGRIDAHIDVRGDLRVFDIAASQIIVKEAGGKVIVRQFDNDKVSISRVKGIKIISASTPQLIERITEIIRWP